MMQRNKQIKKASSIAILALGATLVAGQVCAQELWDPQLRGVDEGLAAGALPPPGVYGVLNNYWASYSVYGNDGKTNGATLGALVEVPIVLWQTGIKVLGADYAVAIAQPFDYTNLQVPGAVVNNAAHFGTYNTVLVPGILSWNLGNDLFVKAGLTVYVDDASSSAAKPLNNPYSLGAGNGFWTLQPDLGVSWLHDGWNLSAEFHYDYNFSDNNYHSSPGAAATSYKSGQEIEVDYTATKTIGNWTAGLGAHQLNQITDDTGPGAADCVGKNGCRAGSFGLGPLLGYQFANVNVTAEYNRVVFAHNDVAGNIINLRLIAPF
jgi:hypothetical protein